MRREEFSDVVVEGLELRPRGCDRVAMVARMCHSRSGRRIAVLNTHLTVAHASNDYDIPHHRPLQMQQVLAAAERLLQEGQGLEDGSANGTAVFIGADLNSDHLEDLPPASPYGYTPADVSRPVHMALEVGFRSALHDALSSSAVAALGPTDAEAAMITGDGDASREGGGGTAAAVRPVSHTCSYAQDGCVDYVLAQGAGVRLAGAFLHPRSLRPDTSWSQVVGWGGGDDGLLSDHRPLVADYCLLEGRPGAEEGGDPLCLAAPAVGMRATGAASGDPPRMMAVECSPPPTFALYLRPLGLGLEGGGGHAALLLRAAHESQRRWGGLHVTLCSFAAKCSDRGRAAAAAAQGALGAHHRGSLREALVAMHAAAARAGPTAPAGGPASRPGHWNLRHDGGAAAPGGGTLAAAVPHAEARHAGLRMLALPAGSPTLGAICRACARAGMHNARRPEQLHMTIAAGGGASGAVAEGEAMEEAVEAMEAMEEAVRVALLGCERWELVIAKCAPGERRVVAFNERIELTW